jgi:hypothetical protein
MIGRLVFPSKLTYLSKAMIIPHFLLCGTSSMFRVPPTIHGRKHSWFSNQRVVMKYKNPAKSFYLVVCCKFLTNCLAMFSFSRMQPRIQGYRVLLWHYRTWSAAWSSHGSTHKSVVFWNGLKFSQAQLSGLQKAIFYSIPPPPIPPMQMPINIAWKHIQYICTWPALPPTPTYF